MGDLTEAEIFDCLKSNLRQAAQCCDDLAVLPKTGPTYRRLRDHLKLIEGSCKQAAVWRQDARWFTVQHMFAEAHKDAGGWLRGVKVANGPALKLAPGDRHPRFVGLARKLRAAYEMLDRLQNQRTGKVGTILPKPLPGPHRDTRPVHVSSDSYAVRKSGLIVPREVAA